MSDELITYLKTFNTRAAARLELKGILNNYQRGKFKVTKSMCEVYNQHFPNFRDFTRISRHGVLHKYLKSAVADAWLDKYFMTYWDDKIVIRRHYYE